jgi:hypothetical protein
VKLHRAAEDERMATRKRTTMYSTGGKKLYAVRNADGTFNDIQSYARAHRMDMQRTSADEVATAAKKAPAKKKAAKKAAGNVATKAVKTVAKKAVRKVAAKKAVRKVAKKAAARKAPAKKKPARKAAKKAVRKSTRR